VRLYRQLAIGGLVALGLVPALGSAPVAGAAASNPVTWGCFNQPGAGCPAASFSGYATGSEIHLSALPGSTTQVADLDQAFSGATTASAGLTSAINSETGANVQPAEAASVHAYGTGSGLELGLVTPTLPASDVNQVQVAGHFAITAPPNTTLPAKQIGPINLSPLATASVLTGDGSAVYDSAVCPLGQPISYGTGDAADAGVLVVNGTPVVNTAGTDTSTAESSSQTYLTSNGDGTFGLTTQASDVIAPVTVTLPGGLTLSVLVQTAGGASAPISLTAHTTGESTGATLTFSSDDVLIVRLGTTTVLDVPLSSIGAGGLHIPLSTSSLGSTLTTLDGAVSGLASTLPAVGPTVSSVLTSPTVSGLLSTLGTTASAITNQLAVVSLGSIDVDTAPHVIGQAATDLASPTGGTAASGSLDLLHLNLTVSGTVGTASLPSIPVANLYVGHLETVSNLTNPITCSVPVIKTSNPTAVTAGQSFTYNIEVPDPAKIGLIDCDLDNLTVTDTITDAQGTPSFQVTSATDTANNQAGTIDQVSRQQAIVTFTGLSYTVATSGPPNAPIPISIAVSVPATSTAGVITDTAVAQATAENCHGGASASTGAATGANGVSLTGSYTLAQPSVAALPATPAPGQASGPAAAGPPSQLPFTGAMGGWWQPLGGLGALGAGVGAIALLRRSRRLGA
jgi:hypothetical protein